MACRCWWTRPTAPTTCPWPRPFGWQGGALEAGADLVVQSPHKTLPSLTQTALLHLGGVLGPAFAGEVERQLDVFETSSPSYPLMASRGRLHRPAGRGGRRLVCPLGGPAGPV